MSEKIDFVVTWVDGSDPNWLKEKSEYIPKDSISNAESRFKDWGIFKYWFRGVEKFAPWVNKVFLITWGHLPEWLNIDSPKLVIVNHKDFIPKEYLPTFNSNAIELNIHRIKELSENFVLFNDDMFIIKDTKKEDFFRNSIPCDNVALNVHCHQRSNMIQSICNNNVGIINDYFDFKKSFKQNKKIWFDIRNERLLLRTFALMGCPRFPGFFINHLPVSYNKSTFCEIWKKEFDTLNETASHKFRQNDDVNHWLMREWQIAEGNVKVRFKGRYGKVFHIEKDNNYRIVKNVIDYIEKQRGRCICINDTTLTPDSYDIMIKDIINSFEKIMPEKSSFEK